MGSLVYFKKFDIEDYKELIKKSSKSLFKAYDNDGINLDWSNQALNHYAPRSHAKKYSGRRFVEFIDSVVTTVKASVGALLNNNTLRLY